MAGLMIESHINPDAAWSDAKQQVTPAVLGKIIEGLVVRKVSSENKSFKDTLSVLREQIDQLDDEIFQKLAARMKISEKIGQYKKKITLRSSRLIVGKRSLRAARSWALLWDSTKDLQEMY